MAKIPSYRLHRPSGRAVVTIRGKDVYLGEHGSPESKRLYQKTIAAFLLSGSDSLDVKTDEISICALAVAYIRYSNQYYDIKEQANIRRAMRPISELLSDIKASDFAPRDFKICQSYWVSKGSSRQYANKQAKRVATMLRWAVGEGLLAPSIYEAIKCVEPLKYGRTVAREAPPIRPVSDSVVDATLPHLPKVVADMVRLQRLLGCRPGELCSLTPAMVDRSGDVWEINVAKHKNAWRGKVRTIYVGPQAQKLLAPYLLRASDAHCFSPKEAQKQRQDARNAARTTPPSCGNRPGSNRKRKPQCEPGDAYDTLAYGKAIGYACRKAWPAPKELDEAAKKVWHREHSWAPNRLRHAFATQIRKSDGIEAASVLLGHSQLGITQVYAEADRAKAIDVSRRIL